MKKRKENIITDFSFISLMLLMLISSLFILVQEEQLVISIIMMSIVFFVAIITYFTTLTMGLVLATIIIFVFLTGQLCWSIFRGGKPDNIIYFWSILLPLFTMIVGVFSQKTIDLQVKNEELNARINQLMTIDEQTGLRNQKAFSNDALAYINMSKRYGHHLILSVMTIRHQKEIQKIIGKEAMNKLIDEISHEIEWCVRKEDLVYLIDRDSALWAILFITNDKAGVERVNQKIKEEVRKIEVKQSGKIKKISIEMCIGQASCEICEYSPVEFLAVAKSHIKYDV